MKTLLLAIPVVAGALCAQTQLTVYNENFAVVKEARKLDLTKG